MFSRKCVAPGLYTACAAVVETKRKGQIRERERERERESDVTPAAEFLICE